jgi:hypothetical protein
VAVRGRRGGPVVDFYNAGADFGAPIAAESAREGGWELWSARLGTVHSRRPDL